MLISRRAFCLGTIACALMLNKAVALENKIDYGYFKTDLHAKFITKDHRSIKLLKDFVFISPKDVKWVAPAGAIVDGASIPDELWSVYGSPYVGAFRRASVIHDYYCQTRDRDWKEVHKVFFFGCRADGFSLKDSLKFYAAIKLFGPRWDRERGFGKPELKMPKFDKGIFEKLNAAIETNQLTLEEIEKLD